MSAVLQSAPTEIVAPPPAEARGLARDAVRLMVATPAGLSHVRFRDLPAFLDPGDVVVVNTSATLPAALPLDDGGLLHLSTRPPGGYWVVELRRADGDGSLPDRDGVPGERLGLPGGVAARLLDTYPAGGPPRLWLAQLDLPEDVHAYLAAHGRPIRYAAHGAWPLAAHQTVFATDPGSAEMPSAGRPFTAELVTRLVSRGIDVAPITLHTGVSSQDLGEPPYPEAYRVPVTTAARVNAARRSHRRVVAVGTTVTRALATVTDDDGTTHPGAGWTDLVLGPTHRQRRASDPQLVLRGPTRPVRAVDGLVTGWHDAGATHLDLLRAVAGDDLVAASYAESASYDRHEFGDSALYLP